MSIPSYSELANILVSDFDRNSAVGLDRAITQILQERGLGIRRAEEVAYNVSRGVLRHLQARTPEELPFRLCDDGQRLVGKARGRASDDATAIAARSVHGLADILHDRLLAVSTDEFEIVSAAALVLAGAREMHALCTGDEGGIDFFGRLEVRPASAQIPPGILHTTILPKELLVLGQAKRYPKDIKVGRPDIQKFKGQVSDCLDKYVGNARPPSHRVPDTYYHAREPHLGIFVTTGSFAETAMESTGASGIVLVSGIQLAQFLAFHRIGIVQRGDGLVFDEQEFLAWLNGQRRLCVTRA